MTPLPRLLAACLLIAITGPAPVLADDALLTVYGSGPGEDGPVLLSREQLLAMPQTEIATATPWTDGIQSFVGVTGRDLVAALGVEAETVLAHAINDYQVAIPFEVFATDSTLIAYSRNGAAMDVRGNGPLWVIFPFDAEPRFSSDLYLAYSIWNLDSVRFE